ncbi:glycyl-radical enzyme activating protein [Vallitalea sp.]|jgi:pyruvate formate lyase activating enzyme|uniref:glycyl-radical enzyme activating protein n=1 Tax=Vallitalea sp. TaxID=1882829 RepID=UPI0025D8685D|nr:glycyl-radical enzyme activating protein [Vallitalea sp.]MCT4687894.1 glycyl-radical enzyme activating protein [Vallitalea sp.]
MIKEVNWEEKGTIFNIQRFSLHDGSGIRTIIFFKGCTLRCKWCSNPESQNYKKQIMFINKNCIQCNRCVEVCPTGAIDLQLKSRIAFEKCNQCGKCIEVCNAEALEMSGKNVTVKEVFDIIMKDSVYYRRSGGGVTLSGGEALLQPEFAREILKACKQIGLNTAIETAAFVTKESLQQVLPYTDLVLLDIKIMNSTLHRRFTGQNNDKILKNAEYITQCCNRVIIRIPVITGVNDTEKNILDTVKFAKKIHVNEIHLLPYHRLGTNKYEYLGYIYEMQNIDIPLNKNLNKLKNIISNSGLKCKIGG